MMNNSFTLGYAHALRDATLSLSGKGLYLVLSSFIGMPGWVLTKAALEAYCESRYALEKAWRELQDRGYLKHYCMIDSRGAFVHSYELMQEPSGTPTRMTHVAGMDRENGDLRMVLSSEKKRDFVRVPNALLRSQTLPLAVKGLFSVVAHLAGIPNFSLNPDGIRSFCKEKAKHFATLWRALKLFGLLKQHRHPAGMDCHFSYEYELLDTPDTDAPYLVNHRADGSVSSSRTIADYISSAASRLKAWLSGAKQEKNRRKNIVRKADAPPAPVVHTDKRADEMRRQIDADRLSERFGPQAANLVVKALTSLAGAQTVKVGGAAVPQEERQAVVERVTHAAVATILSQGLDLSRAKNPAAYLRSVLYTALTQQTESEKQIAAWHAKWDKPKQDLIAGAAEPSEPPLADWELAWLAQVKDRRERRRAAIARGEEV